MRRIDDDVLPGSCAMRLLAEDAVALLDHLGGERAHVLGFSLGGAIARPLGQITAPTLVLVGVDDLVTPVSYSQALLHGIPGATLQVLDPGGHAALFESAAASTAARRHRWMKGSSGAWPGDLFSQHAPAW